MKRTLNAARVVGRSATKHGIEAVSCLFVCLLLAAPAALAEIPATIGFDGRLNQKGGPPIDDTVAMTVRIYNDGVGGVPLFTEFHPAVVVTKGKFSVELGSVDPAGLSGLNFDDKYWLGVTVDGDSEMTPRLRFNSVAYAHRSARADKSDRATLAEGLASGPVPLTRQVIERRFSSVNLPGSFILGYLFNYPVSCPPGETLLRAGVSQISTFGGGVSQWTVFQNGFVDGIQPYPGSWSITFQAPTLFPLNISGLADIWALCIKDSIDLTQ